MGALNALRAGRLLAQQRRSVHGRLSRIAAHPL